MDDIFVGAKKDFKISDLTAEQKLLIENEAKIFFVEKDFTHI